MLETMDILPELELLISKVSDKEMDYRSRSMFEPGENDKILGTIHNELVRRLFCVGTSLISRSMEVRSRAESVFDEEEQNLMKQESARLNDLREVVQQLMWHQLRQDMSFWEGNIGVRRNWIAVQSVDQPTPPNIFEFIKRIST